MTISASSTSAAYSSAVSKTSSTFPVAEPPPPALPRDRNPAASSEDMARSYAGIAEMSIAGINQSIRQYEYYKSDVYREAISSPQFLEHIERLRQLHGDEAANTILASVQPERMMELERQNIEADAGNIWGHFNISGALYSYDAATDTYGPGQFTLSVNAGYFAVKVDSATGAKISTDGGSYRDFVRNYAPNAEFLPYEVTDQKLFDIVA